MILKELKGQIKYHKKHSYRFAEHDYHNVFKKAMSDLAAKGFEMLQGKNVLDLGCGQRFPFALQCAADGAKVTALDLNYVKPEGLVVPFFKTVRHNGIKRGFKSLLRKMLFDPTYYQLLEKASGKPLRTFRSSLDFVLADAESASYPFPSDSFDLIASNAVLEHVVDVPRFASEIYRLLRPEGYFYGFIHNYFSISGGHNLDWAFPDEHPSKTIPPWDHLRMNRYPTWVHLNRLKPEEYHDVFSDKFDVVTFEDRDINHDRGGLEGERFLTSDLEKELGEYSRDLLLTRSYCIICKKRNQNMKGLEK